MSIKRSRKMANFKNKSYWIDMEDIDMQIILTIDNIPSLINLYFCTTRFHKVLKGVLNQLITKFEFIPYIYGEIKSFEELIKAYNLKTRGAPQTIYQNSIEYHKKRNHKKVYYMPYNTVLVKNDVNMYDYWSIEDKHRWLEKANVITKFMILEGGYYLDVNTQNIMWDRCTLLLIINNICHPTEQLFVYVCKKYNSLSTEEKSNATYPNVKRCLKF